LRQPFPPDFARRLTGRRIERVGRRAKYLVIHLEDGLVLLAHLGMSGRMVIRSAADPVAPGPHDHVILAAEGGTVVTFTDPRRFGLMTLAEEDGLASHPLLAGLGPEPLDEAFGVGHLVAAFAGRSAPVKTLLLDQRLVAGLGNIYVCESLFRAGISPLRPAGEITRRELGRLVPAIRAVLAEAIAAGGSSLRDHVRPDGELGYFQHSFAVYGRTGEACPGCTCDLAETGGIRRVAQGGRSTFFCARRQK
jgi:formamidopyrimidine-DNA glycosylase